MNSFVTTQYTDPDTPITIKNDGWFPDIELTAMREATRLDGTVTDPRLKQAAIEAIIHVNGELSAFKIAQLAAGIESLETMEADQVNEESIHLARYRRAVYSMAKADLIERYRDFDLTGEGNKKAEWLADSPDEQRRNAQWAIADILGKPHMTVELI